MLRSDVLIAPHHGSATSSSWPFLLAVKPSYSVFQVGYRNTYHHPHTQTVNRYALMGTKMLRSDFDGAVLIDSSMDDVPVVGYRFLSERFWRVEGINK